MKNVVASLCKAAHELDLIGCYKEADALTKIAENIAGQKRIVEALGSTPNLQTPQAKQNFGNTFMQTYQNINKDVQIPQNIKQAVIGILNQIGRQINFGKPVQQASNKSKITVSMGNGQGVYNSYSPQSQLQEKVASWQNQIDNLIQMANQTYPQTNFASLLTQVKNTVSMANQQNANVQDTINQNNSMSNRYLQQQNSSKNMQAVQQNSAPTPTV